MSALAVPAQRSARTIPRRPGRARVVAALARQEAWRIVRHPIGLIGLTLYTVLVATVSVDTERNAFDVVVTGPTWFYGVFVYFAANLVTSRDRRADSDEVLTPAPTQRAERTAAMCLAALGPTLLIAAVVAALHTAMLLTGQYASGDGVPSIWHLAHAPLTVLGACLLGTMVSRWAPFPGAAALVMIAMVIWNVFTSEHWDGYDALGTYATWSIWSNSGVWVGLRPGSPAWHDVYLLALCCMAAAGAVLPVVSRRRRLPVLVAGAVFTALMVVAGWAQLP